MAVVAAAPPMTSLAEGMRDASSRPGWTERPRVGAWREDLPAWALDLLARGARGAAGAARRGGPAAGAAGDVRACGRARCGARSTRSRSAPAEPARVRRLRRRPEAALLVDRYDDDWSRLAWVELRGDGVGGAASGRRSTALVDEVRAVPSTSAPPGPLLRLAAAALRATGRPSLRGVRAMVLDAPRAALRLAELPDPEPGPGEVLLEVAACGVCRTDLHIVDGELTDPKLPLVPGHQIVGRVVRWRRALPAPASGWACPGSAGPTATAATAAAAARTSATALASPATPRRRLRRADRRRRALLLPAAGRLSRPPGRAAAVRRPDRLPRAAAGRRRRAARPLRLRRRGAHRLPGGPPRGPARVRLHARRTTQTRQALRARARRRVGRRRARPAARGARRRDHLRARRRAGAGRAAGRGQGRRSWSAAAST